MQRKLFSVLLFVFIFSVQMPGQSMTTATDTFEPLSFQQADALADSVLRLMTLDEKISYVGGDRNFFVRPIPRLKLREVYMSDATEGVHIRDNPHELGISDYAMEKSTSFPSPICLAAAWDPQLAHDYARSVGEECRLGGIGILLGPGQNEYRHAQCGRNFEYFGEDPYLRSRLIEQYVAGLQSTGTVATLKHFVANNTDYYRRKSNSVVDERTLHEIYLPSFKAGIDAGAKAVMTSYNLLNGEYCGQSKTVINDILRTQLGFRWLVMTDWWSVDNGEKIAGSGQDLEMPLAVGLKDARALIDSGKVTVAEIDRMAKSILRVYFAMRLGERKPDPSFAARFPEHEAVALRTAREGIVLLKNSDGVLPIGENVKSILITGDFFDTLARGGGSAAVKGYNIRLMIDEMKKAFGSRINFVKNPTASELASADVVLCNVGTKDSEGWDRPFELPTDQEERVQLCVASNPHTVVIVTSGSGVKMTDWASKAAGIIYAWYVGQIGNQALAEIVSGTTNPSGKLPITIEKDFKDSPGYGYIPAGEKLYTGWNDHAEKDHPIFDINYSEGVFVGYRWYEKKRIEPLFPFGYGLSYTSFEYSDLRVSQLAFRPDDTVSVTFTLKNTGKRRGAEIAQLYVQDIASSVPRPLKELKGFRRIELEPGESANVTMQLSRSDFSYWNPAAKDWCAEKGSFVIKIGSSSKEITLEKEITLQ